MMLIGKLLLSTVSCVVGVNEWGYDHLFKILLIGDSGTGKSKILSRYADGNFPDATIPTIGVDFKCRMPEVDEKICKLQVWDSAGQDRYRTITHSYYRGCEAILCVFDVTDRESYKNLQTKWMHEIHRYANPTVLKVIIGNKIDLVADYRDARSLAVVSGVDHCSFAKLTNEKKRPGKYGLLNVNRATLVQIFSFFENPKVICVLNTKSFSSQIFSFFENPKSDLREIPYVEANAFAESIECPYFEVTAKDDINIDEIFEDTSRRLLSKVGEGTNEPAPAPAARVSRTRSFFKSFGNLFRKKQIDPKQE